MKLLTKNTDYAIRALLALSREPGRFISARQISEDDDIPYEYLRKIFQTLLKEKLVESKGGGQGGFQIRKDPADIRVVDVIQIFQGNLQLTECMFRKKLCHNRAHCVLRHNIMRIEKLVTDEFGGITIQSLSDEVSNSENGARSADNGKTKKIKVEI